MNGILDEGGMTPITPTMSPEELKVEKKMAAFAKTEDFKLLKEHFEGRIEFYKGYQPDGRPLTEIPAKERGNMWLVSNAIIGELNLILNGYLQAEEAVKAATKPKIYVPEAI